jgi:hypothetical protein
MSQMSAVNLPMNSSFYLTVREKERTLMRLLTRLSRPVGTVLEKGFSAGGNEGEMLKLALLPIFAELICWRSA